MTLLKKLPALKEQVWDRDDDLKSKRVGGALVVRTSVPPYGQRKEWVPRVEGDFGDGGAFPEIHVAQYPLGMGARMSQSTALAIQFNESGKVDYSAIARQGHGADKIIYSKLTDLLPSEVLEDNDPSLQKPTEDDVNEITEKTKLALEKLTNAKISAALPSKAAPKAAPIQYVRYTPTEMGSAFNSGAKQRVVKVVEAQSDPMEPPRFRTSKKIPRGPASPPAPVLHSPPRHLSVKQQKEWKVPPCVSNWKNIKGYTVPLDKRLAADGRGLQQVRINENFCKLTEALYIADRKAREAVEARAQLERKLARQEKEKKEEDLRILAQKARDDRMGIKEPGDNQVIDKNDPAAVKRDQLRSESHNERRRGRNLKRTSDKKSNLVKYRERDISEQIALGQPTKSDQEFTAMFDQRLFNNTKGIDSGFGNEDAYNVYDKPWRDHSSVGAQIYRPTRAKDTDVYGADLETAANSRRFEADKQFAGSSVGMRRAGPVRFEKELRGDGKPSRAPKVADDPFGLDLFLNEVKRGSKSKREDDAALQLKKRRRN